MKPRNLAMIVILFCGVVATIAWFVYPHSTQLFSSPHFPLIFSIFLWIMIIAFVIVLRLLQLSHVKNKLLEKSQERFLQLIEHSPEATLIAESSGKILISSVSAGKLFDYDPLTMRKMKLEDLLHQKFRESHAEYRNEYMQDPTVRHISEGKKLRGITRAGKEIPIDISMTPIEHDQKICILYTVYDLTEKLRYEEKVETQLRNQMLCQEINTAMSKAATIKDAMLSCLQLICMKLHWSAGHIYLLPDQKYFAPAKIWYFSKRHDESDLKKLVSEMTCYESLHLPDLVMENKKPLWIEDVKEDVRFSENKILKNENVHSVSAFPVKMSDDYFAVFEFFSDKVLNQEDEFELFYSFLSGQISQVFDRLLSRETLQRQANELKRSNQALDDFSYIASHDLKEPLRGISNFCGFLYDDYHNKFDETGQMQLNTLKKLSSRMTELIESLFRFSRAGRADLALKLTDLNHVISEKVDMISVFLKEKNAEVVVPAPLPTLICDPTLISEVFQNLITNGVKYNDREKKVITIRWTDSEGFYTFSVQDNGIGIPKEYHEQIFKIFKRLHRREEYGGGTGAGMTIIQKIVERHGGKVWIDSEVGVGTTIYFTISKTLQPLQVGGKKHVE